MCYSTGPLDFGKKGTISALTKNNDNLTLTVQNFYCAYKEFSNFRGEYGISKFDWLYTKWELADDDSCFKGSVARFQLDKKN